MEHGCSLIESYWLHWKHLIICLIIMPKFYHSIGYCYQWEEHFCPLRIKKLRKSICKHFTSLSIIHYYSHCEICLYKLTMFTAFSIFNDEGTFLFLTLEMIQMLAVSSAALEVTSVWWTKQKQKQIIWLSVQKVWNDDASMSRVSQKLYTSKKTFFILPRIRSHTLLHTAGGTIHTI